MTGIEKRLAGLLENQRLAVLATERDGEPYSSLLAFAADGDSIVYVATPRYSRKWGNLDANPSVALLIDDRTNSAVDFASAAAATGLGIATECSGDEVERARGALAARHPHLQEFVSAPTTSLLRIEIARWYVVERFQSVTRLDVRS